MLAQHLEDQRMGAEELQPDHQNNADTVNETLIEPQLEPALGAGPQEPGQRQRLSQIEEEMATQHRATSETAGKNAAGQFTSPQTNSAQIPSGKPSSHTEDNEDSEYSEIPSSDKNPAAKSGDASEPVDKSQFTLPEDF